LFATAFETGGDFGRDVVVVVLVEEHEQRAADGFEAGVDEAEVREFWSEEVFDFFGDEASVVFENTAGEDEVNIWSAEARNELPL